MVTGVDRGAGVLMKVLEKGDSVPVKDVQARW
jgi:hypothetical protein